MDTLKLDVQVPDCILTTISSCHNKTKGSNKVTGTQHPAFLSTESSGIIPSIKVCVNEKMFALIPQLLMRAGWLVTPRGEGGDVPGAWSVACGNSRRGSSFQPQVSFCCLDYIYPPLPCMQEPLRPSDGHGIRHEGPIVPTESMSLGLKVETNGLASSN